MANIVAVDFNPRLPNKRLPIKFRRNDTFNCIYMYRSYETE
jgi:hypothetical protein